MRLQTRFRPGTVVLVLCALLFAAVPLTGLYFIDNFDDGNPLTVSGFSDWTAASFSHGSYNLASSVTMTESSGGLHFTGPGNATGGMASRSIARGPFTATAASPFGATFKISDFVTTLSAGGTSYLELTLGKSATEYASVLVTKNGSAYHIGFAWRDGMTVAPVTLVYETEYYITNATALSVPKELTITHNGSQIRFL